MLENCGRDPEGRLATDQAVDNPATADRLLNERSFQTELRRSARERGIDFDHHNGQIGEIAIDKIRTIEAARAVSVRATKPSPTR